MKYSIKPLTKKMLMQLRNARQIELNGIERRYCVPEDFNRSLAGLYSRGLVACKDFESNGKRLVSVYVTDTGINFLNSFKEQNKVVSAETVLERQTA